MAIRKQTFFKGILVIMMSQILIKVLGFVYRIVLTNMEGFSDLGNSYYGSGYSVYAFILAISTMGIPNTISKLVSEKIAVGDRRGAHRIFKVAFSLFTFIGIIFAALLFLGSEYISINILNNEGVKYTLRALSPAIIFVAMTSVLRGYFVGMKNMSEYSKAQIIEQVLNSIFSIVFVVMLVGRTPEIMAAGSTLATTVGTAAAFFYLFSYYSKNKEEIWRDIRESQVFKVEKRGKVVKKLIAYAIPISLGSVVVTLSSLIDTVTVVNSLQNFGTTTLEEANRLYGILAGKVDILVMLPLSVNVAFSVALVPFISSAFIKKDYSEVISKVNSSVKLSAIIAFPAAIGMSLLSKEIFELLFPNTTLGYEYLSVQAFMIIFAVIAQTLYGALHGIGKIYIPAICLFIGVTVKYVLNVALIPIYGAMVASISSVIFQFITCSLAFILLYYYLKEKPNLFKLFFKTICSTIIMGIVIYLMLKLNICSNIYTLFIIFVAIITYIYCIVKFKVLTNDEIDKLPVGKKIKKTLYNKVT